MKFLIVRQEQHREVGAGIKEIKAAAPKRIKALAAEQCAYGKMEEEEVFGEDGL